MAVLCVMFKITRNPMHPLRGAIPVPHVSVRYRLGASVPQDFYSPLSIYVERFADPVFDGVGLRVLRARPMLFCWYFGLTVFFLSILSLRGFLLLGWGLRTDRVSVRRPQTPCIAVLF